jgi:hypothetical protein
MALRDDALFPLAVLGPVDNAEFRRLAAILRSEDFEVTTDGFSSCRGGVVRLLSFSKHSFLDTDSLLRLRALQIHSSRRLSTFVGDSAYQRQSPEVHGKN